MVEHSIPEQRYVIAPLGSPGVTVLVRYPAALCYRGIQDLSNPVSNFPRLADLIVFIRVHWSDVPFKHWLDCLDHIVLYTMSVAIMNLAYHLLPISLIGASTSEQKYKFSLSMLQLAE